MKKISEMGHTDKERLHILMVIMTGTSDKIEPFTRKEFNDWLFPIAMEEPVLAQRYMDNYVGSSSHCS